MAAFAVRKAELFLPETMPLSGLGPSRPSLDFGMPTGLFGYTEAHIPAEGSRPKFEVSLTWEDPSAMSLASTLPTSIEIRTTEPSTRQQNRGSARSGCLRPAAAGHRPVLPDPRERRRT